MKMGDLRMRAVLCSSGAVVVERFDGLDALGVERWLGVDLAELDEYEDPLVSADTWVTLVVSAVLAEVQP
jgi:hypothetical protein